LSVPKTIALRIGVRGDELGERHFQEVEAAFREETSGVDTLRVPLAEESGARTRAHQAQQRRRARALQRLTKELAAGRVDVAVVELPALPEYLPDGVVLGGVTSRRTPYYALVSRNGLILDELPAGAEIGVEEPNRFGQLLFFRPDLRLVAARDEVNRVVQSVFGSPESAAAVLAADDLERFGLQEHIAELLTEEVYLPPSGQGCLGMLLRSGDRETAAAVGRATHEATWNEARAERAFMRRLEGCAGESVGVLARVEGKAVRIEGCIASALGTTLVRTSLDGRVGREEELGTVLADKLLKEGGAEILKEAGVSAGQRVRSATRSGLQT
jgi:hydroxymethylbilane synthase